MKSVPQTVQVLCVWIFLAIFSVSAKQNESSAMAGWAEVDITPPVGISLGGRGAPSAPSTRVLDPIYAQVTYIKDAKGTGFVLVSFDLVGMSHDLSERIRREIVREVGVEWNMVVLNTSHTHSGPYMIRDLIAGVGPFPEIETTYFNTLTEKIVTATRMAAKTMMPVKVEVFTGKSEVAINRRGTNKKGDHAGLIPNPKGPIAEKLWVMKLTPQEGTKAPAIVFSYACHPVIVYGYASLAISADFPGVTRERLREQLGEKVHVQFVQGLAGDVRPRSVADLQKNQFRSSTPADLQKTGTDLANDVVVTLKTKGETLTLDLAGASDRPFFPRDKPPGRELYEKMREEAQKKSSKSREAQAEFWLKRYDAAEGFAKGDAWPTGLIRLTQKHWICHLAGEPCAEWGPKFERWFRGKKIVIFGYAQESISYLPTAEMLPDGGYEVDESNYARSSTPARFTPEINEAMRKSFLRQLSFIKAKVK